MVKADLPKPTPPVAMHDGADQDPSGRRAMTIPEPAFPLHTNPALSTCSGTPSQHMHMGLTEERGRP